MKKNDISLAILEKDDLRFFALGLNKERYILPLFLQIGNHKK